MCRSDPVQYLGKKRENVPSPVVGGRGNANFSSSTLHRGNTARRSGNFSLYFSRKRIQWKSTQVGNHEDRNKSSMRVTGGGGGGGGGGGCRRKGGVALESNRGVEAEEKIYGGGGGALRGSSRVRLLISNVGGDRGIMGW